MSRRLRIVLVHRYFAPDTPPYAHMLESIAGALADAGHQVRVVTCQPSYRREVVSRAPRHEWLGNIEVRRFPVLDDRTSHVRKLLNLVWFCLRLLTSQGSFRGADVVMAATTPPIAVAGVCALLARAHGASFVYHKQDVWPEVSGSRGAVSSLLRRVDHLTERSAERVVVLSEDMADTVAARGAGEVATTVLNNFDPWDVEEPAPAPRLERSGVRLVFAGNLGRFQGIENLAEVVRRTADDPLIEWHFFGDGALKEMVEGLGERVRTYGHRPPEEVAAFIRGQADLGIVSLNEGVIRSAYPSKTMSYLRNGCPLLVLVEPDSELAGMVVAEGLGVTGAQDDPESVAQQLRGLATNPTPLASAAERARATYEERFARDIQLARWVSLMEEVAA